MWNTPKNCVYVLEPTPNLSGKIDWSRERDTIVDSLRAKVGAKIVECLRRLGNYGEVGRELSRQVEVGLDYSDSRLTRNIRH